MGLSIAEADQVDTMTIRQQGMWGLIHEVGHNHQWDSWTVDGTDETGCNWFSLYVNQNVSLM
jgi:hypothetical protein